MGLERDSESDEEPVKVKPPRKTITHVEIEVDEEGVPIWPKKGLGVKWNLETKKAILRNFIREHYRKFLSAISLM